MSVLEIICGIVMIIASLVIIAVIMLQESKQANGLDAVTGASSDNYLGRNGGNTKEAFLAKLTKILAVIFMVVAFGITLLVKFVD
jgi:preprotein translocase subunit SecG